MTRVLTLNCCLLPKYLHQSSGLDNRRQRAQLIHRLIQRYDIVLLQEVFGTFWSQEWRKMFSNVPGMTTILSPSAAKVTDSGLIILSRYPVIECGFRRFKSKSLTNSIINRGYLYAAVQIGSTTLHIVNTHLNPSENHCGLRSPPEYRRRQLKEILAFRAETAPAGHWLIGGDFNDTNSIELLPSTFQVSLRATRPPTYHQLVPYASPYDEPSECIDYITSTLPFTYEKRMNALVSDHYGVEVGLSL